MTKPDYIIGLDLGQSQDPTALAILERTPVDAAGHPETTYAVRHLQRFSLGTAYTAVVGSVAQMAGTSRLRSAPVVVDQTGVGRAVVDLLQRTPGIAWVVPVTITGGQTVTTAADGGWHVPKKELVTCLQLLLQNRRLQVAQALPDAAVLVRELQNFRVRITVHAHETFGAWREGEHDDLVLAVALACWWAERHPPWGADAIGTGGGLLHELPQGVFLT